MFDRHQRYLHQEVTPSLLRLLATMEENEQHEFVFLLDQLLAAIEDDPALAVQSSRLVDFPVLALNDPEMPNAYEYIFCADDAVSNCGRVCGSNSCRRRYCVILQLSQPDSDDAFDTTPSFLILNVFPDSSERSAERQIAKRRSLWRQRISIDEKTS